MKNRVSVVFKDDKIERGFRGRQTAKRADGRDGKKGQREGKEKV